MNRIETENNYRIFSDRSKLRIYMKEGYELNMLTKNKLFELRDRLIILNSRDQGLITKLSCSAYLRD